MSDGSLSSLGISSGVLTYDVIDKLKKADESTMVDPYKRKLSAVQNKENALTDLTTQVALFKTSIADFKDGEIFQKRTADVSGSSVSATVNSGVAVQTVTMDVKQLAKNDIYQSKGYDSETSSINGSGDDQKIHLSYNGQSQDIDVANGATLSDLKDSINNASMGITASIINTGSDDNPYKLVLKGNETGKDATIKMDYGKIDNLGFNQTVYESQHYDDDTKKVNDSGDTQTFKMTVNGTDYSMSLDDGATVKDMVDDINNGNLQDSDGNSLSGVSAKFEDGHIKIGLQDIGDVSISDDNLTTNMNDNTNFDDNANRVQTAQNSEFSYNGVDVERATNKVDDLVVGLTMNLSSTGDSTINIKQDTDSINTEVKDFVTKYNSLVSKIQDLTKYDADKKTAGVFQNESSIRNITSDISSKLFNTFTPSTVTKTDRNGQSYEQNISLNASDFGFTMNRTGFLDFDSTKFSDMLTKDPDKVSNFLTGDNGAFTKISNYTDTLTKGSNSTLELLSSQYKNEEKSYQNSIDDSQSRLDSRYKTMAQQFASYDEMISNYNSQTMAVQADIDSLNK